MTVKFIAARAGPMDEYCQAMHDAMLHSIRDALGDVCEPVGVAFSGGVDSTLLAVVCRAMGYDVRLFTVGFPQSHDVVFARTVASELRDKMPHHTLEFADAARFEKSYDAVLGMVPSENLSWIENAVAFYHVSILARNMGVGRVVAANGIDELFCGYDAYRRALCGLDTTDNGAGRGGHAGHTGDYAYDAATTTSAPVRPGTAVDAAAGRVIDDMMQQKLGNEVRMFDAIGKMAGRLGVRVIQPLLADDFCTAALRVPLSEKIRGPCDVYRKHVMRRLAWHLGVPPASFNRRKKALQYGSGIHKALLRIRRRAP